MVLDHYFTPFLHFHWLINYNHASRCTKFSTHSSLSWFWSKIFSFLWIHGVAHDHILWASNRTNEWRTTSRVIPKLDINATSPWWIFQTARGAPSSWSWTPSSLVLLHFFKPSHLGDQLEIVCRGFYEIKDIFIFTWSSILSVGHYHWLHDSIVNYVLITRQII